MDLCVVVFRTRSPAAPEVGRLVEHSKRQVRGFVGCHKMLERRKGGKYGGYRRDVEEKEKEDRAE